MSIMNDNVGYVDADMGDQVVHLLEVDLQDNLLYRWEEVCQTATNIDASPVRPCH